MIMSGDSQINKRIRRYRNMREGTKVIMNDNYYVLDRYKGKTFEVIGSSWELGGTEVIRLKDYSGPYAVDGLTEVK